MTDLILHDFPKTPKGGKIKKHIDPIWEIDVRKLPRCAQQVRGLCTKGAVFHHIFAGMKMPKKYKPVAERE